MNQATKTNLLSRMGLGSLGAVALTVGSSAHAAIPAEVTTALSSLSTDALTVAGVVLAAIVAIYAFKFIRKGF
jgi:hypothetical protein